MPQPLRKSPFGDNLTVDTSGRVLMPYQPAFYVRKTDASISTTNTVILWNDLQVNTGSHYNASNGRFTAPIAGRYMFGCCGIAGSASGGTVSSGIISIRFNGSGSKDIHWNCDGAWDNVSGTIILDLAVNDYVDFYVTGLSGSGSQFYGYGIYNNAFGHLIG